MINYFNFYLKFTATINSTLVAIVAVIIIGEGVSAG